MASGIPLTEQEQKDMARDAKWQARYTMLSLGSIALFACLSLLTLILALVVKLFA